MGSIGDHDLLLLTKNLTNSERKELYREHKLGNLYKIAPGAYVRKDCWRELGHLRDNGRTQAVLKTAALSSAKGKALVIGKSAALIHQLPLQSFRPPRQVELGSFQRGSMTETRDLKWRRISDNHKQNVELKRTEFGDVWVSGVLDTCRDLALWHPLEDAVVATEFALNKGLLDWDEWQDSEVGLKCRHGAKHARQAYKLITPWSESPRESELKIKMWEAGLPAPFQQATIYDDDGRTIGRLDFLHEEGVASEYDGSEKYGDSHSEALYAFQKERNRETAIQAHGIHFIRVNANNYRDGSAVKHIQTLLNILHDQQSGQTTFPSDSDTTRQSDTTHHPRLPRHRWSSPGKAWRE